MTRDQLKQLEADLWSAADNLRANSDLKSNEDRLLPRLIAGKLSVENLAIQFPPGMASSSAEAPKIE